MIIKFICGIAVSRLIRHRSSNYRFRLLEELLCLFPCSFQFCIVVEVQYPYSYLLPIYVVRGFAFCNSLFTMST